MCLVYSMGSSGDLRRAAAWEVGYHGALPCQDDGNVMGLGADCVGNGEGALHGENTRGLHGEGCPLKLVVNCLYPRRTLGTMAV